MITVIFLFDEWCSNSLFSSSSSAKSFCKSNVPFCSEGQEDEPAFGVDKEQKIVLVLFRQREKEATRACVKSQTSSDRNIHAVFFSKARTVFIISVKHKRSTQWMQKIERQKSELRTGSLHGLIFYVCNSALFSLLGNRETGTIVLISNYLYHSSPGHFRRGRTLSRKRQKKWGTIWVVRPNVQTLLVQILNCHLNQGVPSIRMSAPKNRFHSQANLPFTALSF